MQFFRPRSIRLTLPLLALLWTMLTAGMSNADVPQRFLVVTQVNTRSTELGVETPTVAGDVAIQVQVYERWGAVLNKTVNVPLSFQLAIDEQPVGPVLDVTLLGGVTTLRWDSRSVADGVHAFSLRVLEHPGDYTYVTLPLVLVVDNVPGPVTGPQDIPVCPYYRNLAVLGRHDTPRCDWVHFPGTVPTPQGHPQPVVHGTPFRTLVPNTALYVEHVMNVSELFSRSQRFFQMGNGQIVAVPFNNRSGNYLETGAVRVDTFPISDGPRNVAYVSSYTNGVVHPVTEELIFIEQLETHGRIGKVALDGTVTTIAGFRTKAGFVPYHPYDTTIPASVRAQQYERIGNFVDGPVGFRVPTDVAVDPRNPQIFYVADYGNHRIVAVDSTTTPATVSTYVGSRTGRSGHQDGNGTEALFFHPFSLVMDRSGVMYVSDRDNHLIRKIDADRHVTTVVGQAAGTHPTYWTSSRTTAATNRSRYMVNGNFATATLLFPGVIRLDSRDNLILGEDQLGTIRRVNVATETVELVRIPGATSPWIWLDVDREGTFGPVDDIFYLSANGPNIPNTGSVNEYFVRIAANGSSEVGVMGSTGGNYRFEARLDRSRGLHYPWLVAVGKGALWENGFGTDGLLRIRLALPNDRVDSWDGALWPAYVPGRDLYHAGTVKNFPYGSRPSFDHLHGNLGWNQLFTSPSFDDLAEVSDAELTRMIQEGWGGRVARPEITGNDLRNLIFFIRRHSLPSVRANVLPGPISTDRTAPQISNVRVQQVAPGSVRVTWNTNEPTLGVVQYGPAQGNYSRWSEPEAAYTTSHSVVLNPLRADKTYHFIVRAKDLAGNQAVTLDGTAQVTP